MTPIPSEIAETAAKHEAPACDPQRGNCDCTRWPETDCLLPHALVMEQLKTGEHPDKIVNERHETMLMKARDAESVKALIAAGADVNAKDNEGKSVLSYYQNENENIRLLKEAGAKE